MRNRCRICTGGSYIVACCSSVRFSPLDELYRNSSNAETSRLLKSCHTFGFGALKFEDSVVAPMLGSEPSRPKGKADRTMKARNTKKDERAIQDLFCNDIFNDS